MTRPGAAEWSVLDVDSDPVPGDPESFQEITRAYQELAAATQEAHDLLASGSQIDVGQGKAMEAFRDLIGKLPGRLDTMAQSYSQAADAYVRYMPSLQEAQSMSLKALDQARQASQDQGASKAALATAQAALTALGGATGTDTSTDQTAKDAANDDVTAAQNRQQDAQQSLDQAKALLGQATALRDQAARSAAKTLHQLAKDAPQRSLWEKIAEAFQAFVDFLRSTVIEWITTVLDVISAIASFIFPPLGEAIGLFSGLIDLGAAALGGDLGEIAMAAGGLALGLVPGGRLVGRVMKFAAKGGKMLDGSIKDGIGAGVKGLNGGGGKQIDGGLPGGSGGPAKLGAGRLDDLFHGKAPVVPKDVSRPTNIRDCVSDPIDVATGEMVLPEVDLELPAPLPFALERTHLSSYRAGGLFGVAWASTLDQRIETDAAGTLFFAADAMVLVYPSGEPGTAVLPEEGPRWPLTVAADGTAQLKTDDRLLTFDSAGRLSAVTDPAGNRLHVERDADGTPVALQHPSGRRVGLAVEDGRITGITLVAAGGGARAAIAAFRYDDAGRLIEVTNVSGQPARFRYDDDGRITQWIDRNGFGYRYSYDEQGRCVGTMGEDGYLSATLVYEPGRTTWTDSLGHATHYTFDEYHHRTSTTDPLGNTTRLRWGRHNQLLSQTDPLGRTTEYAYDGRGRPTAVTRPDGVVVAAPAPGVPIPGAAPRLDIERLRGGRPTNPQRVPGLAGLMARSGGEVVCFDAEGYPVERIDAAGGVRRTEYGPFGVVLASVDADGLRTSYTYDTELRITSVTDSAGLVWRYAYDPAGRVVTETDFNGRVRHFTYDGAGQLVTATNGLGEVIEYVRDPLGNLVERRTPTGSTRYGYDDAGRLVMARGDDAELTVEWDDAGRRIAETVNGRTVRLDRDDSRGTVIRHTPAGAVSVWAADPFGRPYALRSGGHELLLRHDGQGRETQRVVDGRPVLNQRHDAADGRLLDQELPAVGRRSFEHRADGEVTAVTDWRGRQEFRLDEAGRVTGVRGPDRDENYRYPHGRPDGEYAGTRLLAAGGISASYDAHGRMTTRSVADVGTWHFTWNADDRLTEVRTPSGDRWRYGYDPLGRRISKRRMAGAVTVERYDFTWSGTTLVEQAHTDADGTLRVTTWEHHPVDGRAVARTVRIGADLDYATVVTDQVGTPTELLGADGELRWQGSATLWGATATPAATQPLAFPGQYRDDETGLHYNVYRYYDPLTGRYLSQDPLGLAPGPDPAAYVGNPLSQTDLLGLMCSNPSGSGTPHPTPGAGDDAALAKSLDDQGDLGVAGPSSGPLAPPKLPSSVIPNLKPNGPLPKYLYHGSDVPPDVIFSGGLKSNAVFKNTPAHYDIKLHQQNSSVMRPGGTHSGFISTTADLDAALGFVRNKDISYRLQGKSLDGVQTSVNIGGKTHDIHHGYIYHVRPGRQPFVDLNSQANADVTKSSQQEWAALDHVPSQNIEGAWLVDGPYTVGVKDGKQVLDFPQGVPIKQYIPNPNFVSPDAK